MPKKYELVVIGGEFAGERFPLEPGKNTRIGRAQGGVSVADPTLSLKHAEISWDGGVIWVRDLGSQTGTVVNGEDVDDEAVKAEPGSEIETGDTRFLIEERDEIPRSVYGIGVAVTLVLTYVFYVNYQASQPIVYEPVATAPEAVVQGNTTGDRVELPESIIRELGADHRGLTITEVSDFDANGIDEVWIEVGSRKHVYTFQPDGTWVPLGSLLNSCEAQERSGFPEFDCQGVTWEMSDGRYQPVQHEGVVAWFNIGPEDPETGRPVKDGPNLPRPYRVSLFDREILAGFLADRGIREPVHYLICEDAIPGSRPQVLTASGKLKPLSKGCIRQMKISGPESRKVGGQLPVAVAFSATGYHALLDDITTTLGGSPDGQFLAAEDQPLQESVHAEPKNMKGAIRLAFRGGVSDFRPVARPKPIPGYRALLPAKGEQSARLAVGARPVTSGSFTLDPEGCSELQVDVGSWHCARRQFCKPGNTFIQISELGCDSPGVLLTVPYQAGRYAGDTPNVQLRVDVTSFDDGAQVDATSALVGFRTP